MTRQHYTRHLAFIALLLLGLSYFAFLYFVSHKAISGFFMQLIFICEQIRAHQFSLSASNSPQLWLNLLVAPTVFYCLFLLVKAFISSVSRLIVTRNFLHQLKLTPTGDYFLFDSPQPQVFTAGLLTPRIYLSSALVKLCTPSELESIVNHERMHAANFDPLKSFIVRFIDQSLPRFPGKSTLFAIYNSYIEITCDQHARQYLSSPRPLVSALLKLMDYDTSDSMILASAFSASSSRIHSLVDGAPLSLKSFYFKSLLAFGLLILVSVSVTRTQLFTECDHLLQCFQLIAHHQVVPITHQNCNTPHMSPAPSSISSHPDTCLNHVSSTIK